MKKTGLYIHVPFCIRKCPYCDFYSVTGHNDNIFDDYAEAVARNIGRYIKDNNDLCFDTVYFGGGTPSLLPVSGYQKIFDAVGHVCDFDSAEVTAEINPKTADEDKLNKLRKMGMNRLSFGIQSASDTELAGLGRIHSFSEAEDAVNMAAKAGFENISADIMIGVRGQTMSSLSETIDSIAGLPVKHISAYMLKIEKGTPYDCDEVKESVPDDDESADMYLFAVDRLAQKKIMQYEISNFAFKGFESRHNLKYWRCEQYIGIGPSAHSYFEGRRYNTPRDLSDFLSHDVQTEITNEEHPGDFFENIMLRIRLTEGYDLSLYPQMKDVLLKRSQKYIANGLMKSENGKIWLTPSGFLISNYIISDITS